LLVENFHLIFMGFHLVYEEYKLRITGSATAMVRLLPVLVNFASCFHLHLSDLYLDFYARDFGRTLVESHQRTKLFHGISITSIPFDAPDSVPGIFRWMDEKISSDSACNPFPQILDSTIRPVKTLLFGFRTHLIVRLYSELFPSTTGTSSTIAQILVEENISLSELHDIPFGVDLPIRQALFDCRANPSYKLSSPAYTLIGREDLACNLTNYSPVVSPVHHHQQVLQDDDGLLLVQALSADRFGADRRMKEVGSSHSLSRVALILPGLSTPAIVQAHEFAGKGASTRDFGSRAWGRTTSSLASLVRADVGVMSGSRDAHHQHVIC